MQFPHVIRTDICPPDRPCAEATAIAHILLVMIPQRIPHILICSFFFCNTFIVHMPIIGLLPSEFEFAPELLDIHAWANLVSQVAPAHLPKHSSEGIVEVGALVLVDHVV